MNNGWMQTDGNRLTSVKTWILRHDFKGLRSWHEQGDRRPVRLWCRCTCVCQWKLWWKKTRAKPNVRYFHVKARHGKIGTPYQHVITIGCLPFQPCSRVAAQGSEFVPSSLLFSTSATRRNLVSIVYITTERTAFRLHTLPRSLCSCVSVSWFFQGSDHRSCLWFLTSAGGACHGGVSHRLVKIAPRMSGDILSLSTSDVLIFRSCFLLVLTGRYQLVLLVKTGCAISTVVKNGQLAKNGVSTDGSGLRRSRHAGTRPPGPPRGPPLTPCPHLV